MARHIYNTAAEICKAKGYDSYAQGPEAYPAATGILIAKINSLLFWMEAEAYNSTGGGMKALIMNTFSDLLEPKKEGEE